MTQQYSTNHYSSLTYKATVFNVDAADIELKLESKNVERIESSFSTIQRYDIKSGEQFVPPIHVSKEFNQLFDEVFHLSSLGISFLVQHVYLLLKKDGDSYEAILSSPYKKNLHLNMNEEQYKQLVHSLLSAGMRQIGFYSKRSYTYFYKPLKVQYTLCCLSQLPSFLEVESLQEDEMVEGLAVLGITINNAIINKPWKKIVLNSYKDPDREVLQFLL